jgi:hypothetical protein
MWNVLRCKLPVPSAKALWRVDDLPLATGPGPDRRRGRQALPACAKSMGPHYTSLFAPSLCPLPKGKEEKWGESVFIRFDKGSGLD